LIPPTATLRSEADLTASGSLEGSSIETATPLAEGVAVARTA